MSFPGPDTPFTPGWRDVHVGSENDGLTIGGLEVWKHRWRVVTWDGLVLWHPAHPHERHTLWVFEIGPEQAPVRFAAGELSAGVWGFFVPV